MTIKGIYTDYSKRSGRIQQISNDKPILFAEHFCITLESPLMALRLYLVRTPLSATYSVADAKASQTEATSPGSQRLQKLVRGRVLVKANPTFESEEGPKASWERTAKDIRASANA